MPEIVPSILEDNPERFATKQSAILKFPGLKRIQVDFADGKFTERKTLSPDEIDLLNPLYHWEAHLMVTDPQNGLFDLKIAGFGTVIIHFESFKSESEIKKVVDEIRGMKMSVGLAVNPETNLQNIKAVAGYFDQILLLAVHPGFQGQQFDPKVYDKIQELRSWNLSAKIEIDGGVKLDAIKRLTELGSDYIVVGSALFDMSGATLSPTDNFEKFHAEVLK
jgi:ribulose-phosphate 3-epimerase